MWVTLRISCSIFKRGVSIQSALCTSSFYCIIPWEIANFCKIGGNFHLEFMDFPQFQVIITWSLELARKLAKNAFVAGKKKFPLPKGVQNGRLAALSKILTSLFSVIDNMRFSSTPCGHYSIEYFSQFKSKLISVPTPKHLNAPSKLQTASHAAVADLGHPKPMGEMPNHLSANHSLLNNWVISYLWLRTLFFSQPSQPNGPIWDTKMPHQMPQNFATRDSNIN